MRIIIFVLIIFLLNGCLKKQKDLNATDIFDFGLIEMKHFPYKSIIVSDQSISIYVSIDENLGGGTTYMEWGREKDTRLIGIKNGNLNSGIFVIFIGDTMTRNYSMLFFGDRSVATIAIVTLSCLIFAIAFAIRIRRKRSSKKSNMDLFVDA
jgi:hypothetical protein